MRYRLLLLLTLSLCFVLPVAAQEPAGLKTLRIALWPEFDDPRLLVILDGEMNAPGQTVRIPLPAQAEVNAVATMADDGNFLNAEWETETASDGTAVVSFKPEQSSFRVEYYAPLAANGGQRIGNFSLPAGYLTSTDTVIEALLPPSATGFNSDPAMQSSSTSGDGGQAYQRSLGAVAAGAAIVQNLSYDNSTGALAVAEGARATEAPAAAPTAAPAQAASGGSSSRTLLIVGLGILAVALVGVGLFGLWRTRQAPAEADVVPPRAGKPANTKPAGQTDGGVDRFCRQCGTEFRRDDRFCRECGAPRR